MKLVAAILIAAAGSFLFFRAYSKSTGGGSSPAGLEDRRDGEAVTESLDDPVSVTRLDFNFPFEINPTADSLPTIVREMREETLSAASRLDGADSLDSLQREALADAASARLRIMLQGDYEAWRAHVRSLGGSIPEDAFDDFEATWRGCASRARMSPISLANLRIRPVVVDGTRRERPTVAFVVKPFVRAEYPDVESDRLDVYEVLFPLHYRSANSSSPDIKTWCGIEYVWNRDDMRWIPRDMTMYGNGFSGKVQSFVF